MGVREPRRDVRDGSLARYPYRRRRDLLCQAAAGRLRAWVSDEDAEGLRCVEARACAALYALLRAHPVDERGRCRSCRRRRWPGGRRRFCMVCEVAQYWLTQPPQVLLSHLRRDLAASCNGSPDQPPVPPRPEPGSSDPMGRP